MAKRVKKADRGFAAEFNGRSRMNLNDIQYKRIQDALIKHDFVVSEYEAKWGIDRLQELVSEDMRDRFYRQRLKLNDAITLNDGKLVQHEVEVMCRAYPAMEKMAKSLGHKPLTGECWETPLQDGRVLAITKNFWEAGKVAKDNRNLVVYSLEEIANIIGSREKKITDKINEVKQVFPGAAVSSIKKTKIDVDDEIPF